MEKLKTKFAEFIADYNRRRLFEREALALEATELIAGLMEEKKVTKSELAERLKCSRALVTQVLSGSRNMTLHTFADFAYALGYRIEVTAGKLLDVTEERDATGATADNM